MENDHQEHKNPHVIIVPPPLQGHINPSIQLALKLASNGFTITFVNTHWTHEQITKGRKHLRPEEGEDDFFAGSGLDIRYRTISDGFPLSFDRSRNRNQFMEGLLNVWPSLIHEFVGQLAESEHPPTCLVADTFGSWGSSVASKYGLVYVSFWTQPALVFNLYYHLDLLKEKGHYGSNDNRKDTIDYIPGVKALEVKDLTSHLQETDTSKALHKVIQRAFVDVRKADLLIFNTVEELELGSISFLKGKQPTYAIGPLFPLSFTDRVVEMNLWSESDCELWLNSKPPGSVLYASFGSYAHSDKEDIKIIANGLMLSGISFIWVLRPDIVVTPHVADFLPEGFRENVGDRGLVVPWCKQNAVLTHPAVGGFLTHCGWNSILESIWCRIPMLCFPLTADQMTNRKLAVDDWKVGVNLCEGKLVSSDEVAERVKLLMTGEKSRELRKGIEEIRKKMEKALSSNGSSKVNFDKLVEDVKAKIERNRNMKK